MCASISNRGPFVVLWLSQEAGLVCATETYPAEFHQHLTYLLLGRCVSDFLSSFRESLFGQPPGFHPSHKWGATVVQIHLCRVIPHRSVRSQAAEVTIEIPRDTWGGGGIPALCDVIQNSAQKLTTQRQDGLFLLSRAITRYVSFFPPHTGRRIIDPRSRLRGSSLNKLFVYWPRLRRNDHICGCGHR